MAESRSGAAEIDQWYRDSDGGFFKVVAIESGGDAIEVQYYDGTVAELDSLEWRERRAQAVEAPEDWSGAVDISREDFRTSNDEETEPEKDDPLDRLE